MINCRNCVIDQLRHTSSFGHFFLDNSRIGHWWWGAWLIGRPKPRIFRALAQSRSGQPLGQLDRLRTLAVTHIYYENFYSHQLLIERFHFPGHGSRGWFLGNIRCEIYVLQYFYEIQSRSFNFLVPYCHHIWNNSR